MMQPEIMLLYTEKIAMKYRVVDWGRYRCKKTQKTVSKVEEDIRTTEINYYPVTKNN